MSRQSSKAREVESRTCSGSLTAEKVRDALFCSFAHQGHLRDLKPLPLALTHSLRSHWDSKTGEIASNSLFPALQAGQGKPSP